MGRPDYVKCIQDNRKQEDGLTHSLCGRQLVMEWAFMDISHAFNTSLSEGRLMICPECSEAVRLAIRKQTWGLE